MGQGWAGKGIAAVNRRGPLRRRGVKKPLSSSPILYSDTGTSVTSLLHHPLPLDLSRQALGFSWTTLLRCVLISQHGHKCTSSWYLLGLLQCYPLLFPIWLLTPWEGSSLGQQKEPPEYHIQAQKRLCHQPKITQHSRRHGPAFGPWPLQPYPCGPLSVHKSLSTLRSHNGEEAETRPTAGPSKALGPI